MRNSMRAYDLIVQHPASKIQTGNTVTPEKFTTHSLPISQQLETWCGWYGSIFDTESRQSTDAGFPAENVTWKLDGFAVSRASTPAISVVRTKTLIRRNPVDHWAVTLGTHSETNLKARDVSLNVPAKIPFVLSLGEEMHNERRQDDRVQFYLARDSFQGIAALLDAARGTALNTPQGRLLAEYMLLLERNLPNLTLEDVPRLTNAVQAMLGACLAPSADRVANAGRQIDVTLLERVRQAVRRHLRSPSLGPDKLCREAATSRSQLYRLLEGEGGVAHYIQRRRLSESFAILCDTSNNFPISLIAETLCFADASSFSRAFRREFGMRPSDVRAAALAGLPPAATPRYFGALGIHSFSDCLRAF
jgi:AraC-like DNA-binding protein